MKSLPHSREAEEYLLSSVFIDAASVLPKCREAGITPGDFHFPAHQVVFEQMLAMDRDGEPVEIATLAEELRDGEKLEQVGGIAFLAEITSRVPTTAGAADFVRRVRDLGIRRRVIAEAGRIAEHAAQSDDVAAVLSAAGAGLGALAGSCGSRLRERILSARLDTKAQPPELREVFRLKGTCIATPGNLNAWVAGVKTGKTAAVGAAIGSTMTQAERDFLGFSGFNAQDHAVVHFDTEQAPADHWRVINTARLRAGIETVPSWLYSFGMAGWSASERRKALPEALKLAFKAHGGIHSVFLDGVADFVDDPNDGAICFPFVDSLQALAVQYDCPVVAVLHLNPGSEKSRGHLGSHLERRAETNLRLEKDADTGRTVIFSEKQRRAPILKADGPAFRWDDAEQMHVTVETLRGEKDAAERDHLREIAADVRDTSGRSRMRYGELVDAVKKTAKCGDRTAETNVRKMRLHGIVRQIPGRLLEIAA